MRRMVSEPYIAASPDPAPPLANASSTTRRQRFARGLKLGTPVFLGYMPVGMAFGILARTAGFEVWQAFACSLGAFAGAGQFIGLSVLTSGAGVGPALAATAVVNMRYVLFSTTLSPYLKGVRQPTLSWLAFSLTDETFAINAADRRTGLGTPASMAGVGAVSLLGWVLGTLIGAVGAEWIGDPSRFGVEFAMPAMFAALFVALADDRRHIIVGLSAAVIALVLPLLGIVGIIVPASWSIVVASVVAATAASVVFK